MLNEYPRPQLVRDSYICLNGEWEYAITKSDVIPSSFDGKILVPFSPEKVISGVNKLITPTDYLYYKFLLDIPLEYDNDIILLHFGAVDQICDIYINNTFVFHHEGGFLPFEFNIKPYLKNLKGTLILRVRDLTDSSYLSRGKQRIKHGNIWYTPQSGIYMPVWLESVPNDYIKRLIITPDFDNSCVNIKVDSESNEIECIFDGNVFKSDENHNILIKLQDFIAWCPENPVLYDFEIRTKNDKVKSYFAMRKISIVEDSNGYKRIALNNKPYFMKGVLDQGYYEEGSLTPSSDDDYVNDIKTMKEMGFNTLRKHIKIESLRWYYHCDKIGMLVWQDFVNGGTKYNIPTISFPLFTDIHLKDNKYRMFGRMDLKGKNQALKEFTDTIDLLYNSPSIVLWTIFNEGWGQFDAQKALELCKKHDKTRLFDHASGWHDQGTSDTKSLHVYFKRVKMPSSKKTKDRAIILSECGGYTLPIEGHLFEGKKFGYKSIKNEADFLNKYSEFIEKDIIKNIPLGLCAFIYTQLSDVEEEVNGLITYDRKVIKVNKKSMNEINGLVKY